MLFKTPDGKEFATRTEWRDYMMETFYSFKNKNNETLMKKPGDVDGQGFDIADCDGSTLIVMDNCEQVQIDEVKNSRIFIGACASSIFIRNCTNCTFYTSCRQL
jgi:protein XRP2